MNLSITGKKWEEESVDELLVSRLSSSYAISDLTSRVLASKVRDLKEAEQFLSPKIKNLLPDPFHLLDMREAVNRVVEALLQNQKICIFADYDVDGATSSALLKNVFRDLGLQSNIYVPDRLEEGYGPSIEGMQSIKASGAELVITVDCGTAAFEVLAYAKEIGLGVIVLDHHISADKLPDAVAIVNPNRLDEISEYRYLAAVGVAFLFAIGLVSELKRLEYFTDNLPAPNLLNYLDIVALGTVCDLMPISGLNRALVSQGLKVMSKRQNPGIKALCDIAGVDDFPNCYHLGFIIGPRINAGGRVGKSDLGARLLSELDDLDALSIAKELDVHNNERRVIELNTLQEAHEIALLQQDQPALFIAKDGWHPGVIGIVAGRLKEKYNKPVAVIAINDGIGKASCRSIRGVDFGNKVIEAKNRGLLVAGGGHPMAAGFTVMQDKINELKDFLNELFDKDIKKLDGLNTEKYNAELTTSSFSFDLLCELERLAPYGQGNPEPLFKISNLFVLKADIIGGSHIKCLLCPSKKDDGYGNKAISAIAFNAVSTEFERILLSAKALAISVIGVVKVNKWQDRRNIQLQIRDIILEE
jgi:single-stranded-DNA-specific exonuclease